MWFLWHCYALASERKSKFWNNIDGAQEMYTMRVIHMWILIVFNPSKRKATWISTKKASFTDYVVNTIMSCRNDLSLVEKCNIWRARCIIQQLVPLCISHSHVSYARIFFFCSFSRFFFSLFVKFSCLLSHWKKVFQRLYFGIA